MATSQRAAFLDRDGTLCQDVPYCARPEDFNLLPRAAEGVSLLNSVGFKVVVVTNQSGIGRGYFAEADLARIHEKMRRDLAHGGAYVDAIYYCPHHPQAGCSCRKPQPGLVRQAAEELGLDLIQSFFIGDKLIDIETGHAAGCSTIQVCYPPGGQADSDGVIIPDHLAPSLYEAASWIAARYKTPEGRSGKASMRAS